jgi:poly(3-hydroxybutyrate) depolymerase
VQPAVGHYGVFNGSRFRSEIVPRIVDFITSYGRQTRVAVKPKLVRIARK